VDYERRSSNREDKLIAGRKLLLADDSAAVQKVIELTFADEGMEVFSVGDGQSALDRLEQVTPDVVLADAFMPGLNGYELCRSMKDDQRFAQIPVMLLVSSFAPLDEAEAQRVGADDIITKPFQSIRQLVSRVDSLLSGQRPRAIVADDQSMEFNHPEEEVVLTPADVDEVEPQVTVLVEAAQMETALPHEHAGGACAPDIEFQTADTARLVPAFDEVTAPDPEDTIEIEPQFDDAGINVSLSEAAPTEEIFEMNEPSMTELITPNRPTQPRFSESLLDLDESEFATSAIVDEVVLDLDADESPVIVEEHRSWDLAPVQEPERVEAVVDEPEVSLEVPPESSSVVETAAADAEVSSQSLGQHELSAEAINAIAERVIERMSDRVVREIAWEVVPELSELMIRKKLDQK
jgi:CheY-like chemotaxis protein